MTAIFNENAGAIWHGHSPVIPYPHQSEGADFIRARRSCLIADPPGLGKTAQALMGLDDMQRLMVVCPASVKENWARECRMWRTDLSPRTMYGRSSFRFPMRGECLIYNHDILDWVARVPKCKMGLILDEVHACKGEDTRRRRLVERLTSLMHPEQKIVGLTGTPVLNRPMELWNVLRCLQAAFDLWPSRLSFAYHFTCEGGRWLVKGDPLSRLNRMMLRRERDSIAKTMPEKRWQTVLVRPRLSGTERRLLNTAHRKLETYLAVEGHIDPRGALPAIHELSMARRLLAMKKLPFARELALEYVDEPIVVFCDHRDPVIELGSMPGWTSILGDVSVPERQRRIMAFQDGEHDGIALTIGAGREGINLHRACNMILIDSSWVPAFNAQAEGRIDRLEQHRACLYTYIVADHPLDRRVFQLCHYKEELFAELVLGRRLAQIN